jgi:cytoskeletal protein CcmA (bactofilin family)
MLNKGSIFSANRDSCGSSTTGGRVITSTNSPTTSSGGNSMSSTARATEPAVIAEPVGAKLVVGPGVKLKGAEILDCDMLLVEGRVEATMDSRLIQIADQGSFDGKVNIDVAEIRGRFTGELTARDHLIVHATGRVSGKIRYGKIVVHDGGEISGDIKSLNATEPVALAKTSTSTTGTTEAANTDDSNIAAVNRLLAKAG